MANTHGGELIFGISDSPRTIVGINNLDEIPDESIITNRLQEWFQPCINYEIFEVSYNELTLLVIRIQESNLKPVVCTSTQNFTQIRRGKENVKNITIEGDIYRRYNGRTERIKFAELNEIIIERQQSHFEALLENMRTIQKIGVERIGIADLTASSEDASLSKIYLSNEAIKNLNLIDKGKFVETEAEGDPAYFVNGTVQLHETTEIPVDDNDRIRPKSVVETLAKDAQTNLFPEFKLSANHLNRYAKFYKLRINETEFDNRYCKYDEQADVWFYREAFARRLRKELIEEPRKTLEIMAARKYLERFDDYHK